MSGHLIEHIKAGQARKQGTPKKNHYVSAKDHFELQHMGSLGMEDRFGCIVNSFARRAWQLNTADESAKAWRCRTADMAVQ